MADPALTPQQRLRCAVAYYCDGVQQSVIANLVGVNQGRVAEACVALWLAANDPKRSREVMREAGMEEQLDLGGAAAS